MSVYRDRDRRTRNKPCATTDLLGEDWTKSLLYFTGAHISLTCPLFYWRSHLGNLPFIHSPSSIHDWQVGNDDGRG